MQCVVKLKLSILFLFFSLAVFAQYVEQPLKTPPPAAPAKKKLFDRKKLFTGGNIGLQFGTVTFVEVSPLLGYRFTDKIQAGVGLTYQYYSYRDKNYKLETSVYGGRVFGRYFFLKNVFAHAEYEVLNLQAYDLSPPQRVNVGSLLGGVGLIQRFSDRAGLIAMILWNFTPSAYTPYQNPIIRVGFVLGL